MFADSGAFNVSNKPIENIICLTYPQYMAYLSTIYHNCIRLWQLTQNETTLDGISMFSIQVKSEIKGPCQKARAHALECPKVQYNPKVRGMSLEKEHASQNRLPCFFRVLVVCQRREKMD